MLVQMLCFMDYKAVTVVSDEELSNMLTKMNNSFKKLRMKINKNNAKIVICSNSH